MKKLLTFFLCVALCLSVAGCGSSTEERNEEARVVLDKVLAKEIPFTLYNMYIEKISEEILEDFSFPTNSSALNMFLPACYTYVDADGDGVEELVVVDIQYSCFLFLRYDREDDTVYGCMERSIAIPGFKTDGTYTKSVTTEGARVIYRLAFDKTQHQAAEKAHLDEKNGVYQIDGKNVKREEAEKYFADWQQNTPDIQFTKHPDNDIVIPGK